MSRYDFTSQRLFVDGDLAQGSELPATPEQANYLGNVLRMQPGDGVLLFNGRDGEWQARIGQRSKRAMTLVVGALVRPQQGGPDIDYLFAPLKRSRLDYMVQKATEMGVARLRPVLTRRTNAERVKTDRLKANAIEAAEQCGVLRVPLVAEPEKLSSVLASWPQERLLVFCDEDAEVRDPMAALATWRATPPRPVAVLIGPEGGFDPAEREALLAQRAVLRL